MDYCNKMWLTLCIAIFILATQSANAQTDTCLDYEFTCPNGANISYCLVCDHFRDCNDWSDEETIGCDYQCRPEELSCDNGFCVSPYFLCDVFFDCLDHTDESTEACGRPKLCGGELTDYSGTISSPNYPSQYPNGAYCIWTILGLEGSAIQLDFTYFDLENHYCGFCLDWVEIKEKNNDILYCGSYRELPQYISTSNMVDIVFRSDNSVNLSGFLLDYRIVYEDYCREVVCLNGGQCMNSEASVGCVCPAGYTGQLCETELNECLSDPCLNGGQCADLPNRFSCDCPSTYQGDRCETPVSLDDGCDHPGAVADGFVIPDQTQSYKLGKKVEFACREPLMLDGEAEIYCIDGNTWSHPTPMCIKQDESSSGVSVPIIAGAAGGGGLLLIIVFTIIVVVCRKRRSKRERSESTVHFNPGRQNVLLRGGASDKCQGNTYDPHNMPQQPQYEGTLKARPPVPPPRPFTNVGPLYDSASGTTLEARRAAFKANEDPPDHIDVINDKNINI